MNPSRIVLFQIRTLSNVSGTVDAPLANFEWNDNDLVMARSKVLAFIGVILSANPFQVKRQRFSTP